MTLAVRERQRRNVFSAPTGARSAVGASIASTSTKRSCSAVVIHAWS
jgi:hypothetical protein